MDELRPCPFCGGEAELYEDVGGYSVDCTVCGAGTSYFGKGLPDAKGRAVAAWNRRAERTCRIVPMDAAGNPPYRTGGLILNELSDGCSECGYPFDTPNRGIPHYCPSCGARIEVDE